jgi:hypothetical protein
MQRPKFVERVAASFEMRAEAGENLLHCSLAEDGQFAWLVATFQSVI